MIPAARPLVSRPVRVTSPYGLITSVGLPTGDDPHWLMGVRTEIGTCGPATVTTASCAVTGTGDLIKLDALSVRGVSAFTVYGSPTCGTPGFIDDAVKYATDALLSGEGRAVEREFWTGTAGTTPHLAANVAVTGSDGAIEQTAAVIVSGAPLTGVDPVEGLARLEEALGWCYGAEGVIHAPNSVITHWDAFSLLRRDGLKLRSPSNHIVVNGNGYPGTAPDGTGPATGLRWVYATGAVDLRRGPVETMSTANAEILDRAKNDVAVFAHRTYVITWDCCHLAIPIKIGGIAADAFGA